MAEIVESNSVQDIEEVGYFYCYNGSVGTFNWPQIRRGNNIGEIIWDGRDYNGYGLNVYTGVKVNLAVTGISGDFYIGCNTKWGDDKYYGGRNFTYKPGSKRIVCGRSYGGARDGGYTYDGIKTDDLLMEENSEAIVVALEGKHAGSTRFETADARGEEDKSTPADAKKEE